MDALTIASMVVAAVTVSALLLGVDGLRLADFLTGVVLVLYMVMDK